MSVTVTKITNGSITDAVKRSVKSCNIALGAQIASKAKVLVPVDYGQLRNSVSVSSLDQSFLLNDNQNSRIKHVGENQASKLEITGLKGSDVYVGTNSDHALFQEYGTVKQPAQPFLRPAMEEKANGSNAASILEKYSRENMEAELKKRKTKVSTYG